MEIKKTFFCFLIMVFLVSSLFANQWNANPNADPDEDWAEKMVAKSLLASRVTLPKTGNNPLAAGDYYIPKGAHAQGYDSLHIAVDSINVNGVTGTVNLILDADTLREPSFTFNANLSVDNNVVVKPATGRNVCLIVAGGASMGNGDQMIGFSKGFVTFDGSNNGTTSKNLIVTTEQTSVEVPFGLNTADADTIVLKNMIIKNLDNGVTNFKYGAVTNDVAGIMGFTVDNCQIGSAEFPVYRDGVAVWGSSSAPTQGIVINNEIYAGSRGIGTYVINDCDFSGNTIYLMPTTSATTYNYQLGIYVTGAFGSTKIHNNTIYSLEKTNISTAYVAGIAFAGNQSTVNDVISVVNNMVSIGAADETRYTYGMCFRSTQFMGNINAYHNTFVINDNASTLPSLAIGERNTAVGGAGGGCALDLQNNIVINNHTGSTASAAISLVDADLAITSDKNVLVSDSNFVSYQGTDYADLAAWQGARQDVKSVSKDVTFVGTDDLHLLAPSDTDIDIAFPKIPGIDTDIDGDNRADLIYSYAGADEGTAYPIYTTKDLFFSQYIEGGGNNKALEIYNGTGAEVDLSNYIMKGNYNGNAWSEVYTFPAGATIADEDVYVIANNQADAAILAVADTVYAYAAPYYIVAFNGDDVRGLFKISGTDTTMIDIIGAYDMVDPGSGWDVAGVSASTQDHTLIRKSFVTSGFTDWNVIAGTSTDNSEWTVLAKDTFTDLGSHTVTDDAPTTADVTFNVNTSTVRIITDSLSTVDLRGTATQWGPGTDLTCVGGDYWELTIPLAASTGFEYKYGARTTNLDETVSEWWENDIPGADYQGGNRTFSTRYFDQVIDLDYLGGGPDNNTPNYTPTDSVDVFFRVNMENKPGFDPEIDSLYIVGPHSGWAHNVKMNREGTSLYYNYHMQVNQAVVPKDLEYTYTLGAWDPKPAMAENIGNRHVIASVDTTIAWVWWNDDAPQPFTSDDSTDITFNANMSKASNNNSFTIGDTLLIKVGYGNSSTEVVTDTLTRMGFTFSYSTTIAKLPVIYDKQLFYQYYLYKYGVEQREVFFNFDYEGNDVSMNERRFIVVSGTTTPVNDTEDSEVSGRRMPIFRNNDIIAQTSLTLTLECDIRPAIYQVLAGSTLEDIQSNATITPAMMTANPDTILNLGVFVNGPLSNNAEGTWQGWGGTLANDTTRQMYDDGTHGDQWAGDSIFTIVYTLSSDSGHTVGQEFKYGIGGGDNESGYGLNHIENIDDSGTETTLYTQFGSINPNFYDTWDYDNPNPRVDKVENEIPTEFALEQNYPNPFNPSTTIEFAIPKLADVNLTIYNVLGQSIRNIQMNNTQAGRYSVIWNGTNNFGAKVSTGIYFYKIKAGKYSDIKKMVFMK
jgi:hypothetical protein